MHVNPLHPSLLRDNDNLIIWDGLSGSAPALAIANFAQAQKKLVIVITPDAHTAERYFHEINFFLTLHRLE